MRTEDLSARAGTRALRSGALILALALGVVGLPGIVAADSHCDVTLQETDSIGAATDAASAGDVICLEAGTYDEGSASWEIDTPLTLEGLAGSDEVTIDRGGASGTRGVVVSADDVTLRGFTLIGPSPGSGVEYGIKVEFVSGLLVDDVVVRDSTRSGIDLHGVDGATFTDVGSHDNAPGVGFAVTDSHNVDISGLATSGNAWGGMAIFTSGKFTVPAGVSNISVADSSFSGEPAAGLYLQDTGETGPSGFQGISISGNSFSENGTQFAQIDKLGDLADLGVDTLGVLQSNSFDRAVVTGSEDPAAVTVPAIFSAIQDGVDVSDPANGDDAVFVQPGLYEESVNVPPTADGLRLLGFDATVRPVDPPAPGYAFNVRPGDVVIRGFHVVGDGPDGDVSGVLLGGTAAEDPSVVEGNLVEDVRFGVVLRHSGVMDTYVVADNVISNSLKGIVVGSANKAPDLPADVRDNWVAGATDVGIEVNNADGTALHFNRIVDNAVGVANNDDSSLDATHNWWGTPLGTLIPGQTEGDVDSLFWCLVEDCSLMREAHANNFPPHH